tara:strand:+ start:67 stop:1173 length:1107 start_codon:yes stop_codon:yes gene_type:complete
MTKFINLNEQKNEHKYADDAINKNSEFPFKKYTGIISKHNDNQYSLTNDLDVFKAYGVYLEILDCNNLNEPDYKKICILDFFFRSCQYLEFLNIHYDDGCNNLQLLYYLFMIHRTKFNKDLDPKNILIFITQQKIRTGSKPEEPENLFELLNNNYRYWNYYIKILDITKKIHKINNGNLEYTNDNDKYPLRKNDNDNVELTRIFKKEKEFIKYSTCDFYVPLDMYSNKKINDSFLPYSCYQYCKTFEITTKAEIESQEHMAYYFKTEHPDNSLTNEPVNNNKNFTGEDVIEEIIKANPEYVRKFDTIDINEKKLVRLDEKYCKLLVEYNLSYLCLILTDEILKEQRKLENFKDLLSNKEKLYFQKVCQ